MPEIGLATWFGEGRSRRVRTYSFFPNHHPTAMFRTLTLVSLLNLVLPAISSPCAVFDANFNLYGFGLGGKDWNAGTQDAWASGM